MQERMSIYGQALGERGHDKAVMNLTQRGRLRQQSFHR
jgi:hypothetical protein